MLVLRLVVQSHFALTEIRYGQPPVKASDMTAYLLIYSRNLESFREKFWNCEVVLGLDPVPYRKDAGTPG